MLINFMEIKSVITKIKKINITNITKSGVKIFTAHIFGIIILLVFANLAISYSLGEFEIPFIHKTQPDNIVNFSNLRLPNSTGDYWEEEITEAPDSIKDVMNPDLLIAATESNTDSSGGSQAAGIAETTEPDFEFFSEDLKKRRFALTDGVYEPYDEAYEAYANTAKKNYKDEVSRILREAEAAEMDSIIPVDPPDLPEPPLLYEYKLVRIEPAFSIPKSQKISTYGGLKTAVEVFMDYIIIRSGEKEILCTASGKVITGDFAALELKILKMRDDSGNTVFKNDDAYYIYDENMNEFAEINFSEAMGDRGVPFMYPSYYGANGANGLDRGPNPLLARRWGYYISGTLIPQIRTIYDKTFNFSENIGVAYRDEAGKGLQLYFLDETGWELFNSDNYFAPEEATANHLGFFYYDHGLTRVIYREINRVNWTYIDKEMIIDTVGKQFYIPEDYKIKAYSNGMLLLEKNGYYGYMNYLGEWVGNPIYRYAEPFYEGVAVIGLANGKKALIDTKGNLVLKFKYDVITNCSGGAIAYYERGVGWTVLNKVKRLIEMD